MNQVNQSEEQFQSQLAKKRKELKEKKEREARAKRIKQKVEKVKNFFAKVLSIPFLILFIACIVNLGSVGASIFMILQIYNFILVGDLVSSIAIAVLLAIINAYVFVFNHTFKIKFMP